MKSLFGSPTRARSGRNGAMYAIVAALAIMMCCSTAFAQSGAGSIEGTITDTTGAVYPGASIHVVNTATGVVTTAKSNNAGFYQVPALFTGSYQITVTAPEMRTYQRTIKLLVAQNAVINFSIAPGAVTQKVVVQGNAVQLVTTNSGTISSTLENQRIQQLPMNGRNIITLVQETTPGLTNCSQSSSCPNGLFGEGMEYMVDGVTLSGDEFGGTHAGASQMPDPDSIQEVQVQTNGSGAEDATPATGILTTKSGTNHIHGNLFETVRNNAIGIARSRSNPSNFVAPHYVRNEFGGAIGGPIVIPHLYNGKNKSFWFFAYERYSLASSSFVNMRVPTVAMRKGDFSGLINSSGILQQLYDPDTTTYDPTGGPEGSWPRQKFAGNQIPVGRENHLAKVLNDITPLPTTDANPMITTNLAAVSPSYQVTPNITFRLDHVFNQNNRAYLRYTQTLSNNFFLRNDPDEPASLPADGLPAAASGVALDQTALFAPAIGFTHIFSPTFFSETILSQQWFGEENHAGGAPFTNYEKQFGLPNNFGEIGFPIIGNKEIFSPFDGTQFQYGVTQIISDIDENLTKTFGKHQFLFGIRYRHERFGSRPDEVKDSLSFDGQATALENPTTGKNYSATPNTGNANADEFLGAASDYSVNSDPPYQHIHDNEFDAYFQDNYHARRNLTLNLGLRWEAHPAPAMADGIMITFDVANHAFVTASTPAQLIAKGYTTQAVITNDEDIGVKFETPSEARLPSTLIRNYDFTFGPRFGFAWTPFGGSGTVVRGAFGRFIYPEPVRSYLRGVSRSNPFTVGYSMNYTSADQSPDGLKNYLLRSPQAVFMGVNSANVVDSTTTTAIHPGVGGQFINPDFPPNFVNQGNFTIEQPLPGNSALRLSYIYTHGSNLDQTWEFNEHPSDYNWEMRTGTIPPNGHVIGSNQYSSTATGPYDQITYGGLSLVQKSGWSNYNAFQANYQRLFHHGIAYQISYVWSKLMRAGGNGGRDGNIIPYADYVASGLGVMTPAYGAVYSPELPPAPPANTPSWGYYHSLDRFENYMMDTSNPTQLIRFNGIVNLPFGRGEWLLGHTNRALNEIVGGWQLAGDGEVISQDFAVSASNWGPTNPLKVYKHKVPVTDCRSGVCYKEYEWFNGYIAPTTIAGNPCAGSSTKVISGLPADWKPSQSPIDTTCGSKYFGGNEVNITTLDGKTSPIGYSPSPGGSNPYSHTVLSGPMNYNVDLSLFKVFPITESVRLRVNMDAFNAFNIQGYNNPSSSSGLEDMRSSHNTPRQIQLTARLTF